MISREEFAEFRNSPCWQELRAVCCESLEEYAAELCNRTSPNESRDFFCRGAIRQLTEVINWEPEFAPDVEFSGENDEV